MKKSLFSIVLAILILSCASDGEGPGLFVPIYDVDPAFEPYVQEFIEEGAKRGITVDFSDTGLRAEFSDLPLNGAAGRCFLGQHHIEINKENWFQYSERFRSFLLFHELGHCELNQRHRNDLFPDGSWKSIMRGDPFTGSENRIPVSYYGFRKDYYIDEMFNPNTPEPNWSKRTFDYDKSLTRTEVVSSVDQNRVNERLSNNPQSYEIETLFANGTIGNSRVRLEWGGQELSYFIEIIPTWGFYIGVFLDRVENYIYYDNNLTQHNGKPIEKLTVRNHEGVDQIFINDTFIFHLDRMPDINYFKVESKNGNEFNQGFKIESTAFSTLED